MSFRTRLALFLIATLIGVQALTALFSYQVVRGNLIEDGKRQLAAAASVFTRQLTLLSERVTDGVEVLSLDYALRKAVAEQDQATALSALRNHGNRVGATRMLIVGLDGKITTDTGTADTAGAGAAGAMFSYSDLIDNASADNQGAALAVLDGIVYWIVTVPVRAPEPIAFIVACIPVDDALLGKLSELSAFPQSLAIATRSPDGNWSIVSKTAGYRPELQTASLAALKANNAAISTEDAGGHLAMSARLVTAQMSPPVAAILDYPIEQALSAYRAVIVPMLLVLAGVFAVALMGAMLIAGTVSHPLERLAVSARRIAKGDYRPLPIIRRNDEIGQLSLALSNMAQSIAERETALEGAIASIELARNQAVKANEAKSNFLSNMSHELRTPLNAILGFSEMIQGQFFGPVENARYLEYAGHIHDSGAHLLSEIEKILDVSRAADGKLAILPERIAPGGLLTACVEALQPEASKAKVTLHPPNNLAAWPAIDGDPKKLQQSLTNIVHNAIKFTPAGGRVTIKGETIGGVLKISISDTGIGIAAEDLASVVNPFNRGKAAFDGRHQGAGLGLPFAKTIVELHGGKLSIESTPNVGTTVTIELPLAVDAALTNAA